MMKKIRINCPEPVFVNPLKSSGIDFEESIPPAYVAWQSGTTNRVVVPARQAGIRFLVSLNYYKFGLREQACREPACRKQ
jgi:hypothetical protein